MSKSEKDTEGQTPKPTLPPHAEIFAETLRRTRQSLPPEGADEQILPDQPPAQKTEEPIH